ESARGSSRRSQMVTTNGEAGSRTVRAARATPHKASLNTATASNTQQFFSMPNCSKEPSPSKAGKCVPSETQQRRGPRQPQNVGPGNLVVPPLLLPVPPYPQEPKKEHHGRKQACQATNQRIKERHRRTVLPHNLVIEDNAADGGSLPCPHARKVG